MRDRKGISVAALEDQVREKGVVEMGRGPSHHSKESGGFLRRYDLHNDDAPYHLNCTPHPALRFSFTFLYFILP